MAGNGEGVNSNERNSRRRVEGMEHVSSGQAGRCSSRRWGSDDLWGLMAPSTAGQACGAGVRSSGPQAPL